MNHTVAAFPFSLHRLVRVVQVVSILILLAVTATTLWRAREVSADVGCDRICSTLLSHQLRRVLRDALLRGKRILREHYVPSRSLPVPKHHRLRIV